MGGRHSYTLTPSLKNNCYCFLYVAIIKHWNQKQLRGKDYLAYTFKFQSSNEEVGAGAQAGTWSRNREGTLLAGCVPMFS